MIMDFTAIEPLLHNEYVLFVAILLASFAFASIVKFVFKNYLKKLTEKTETDLDDIVIDLLTKPLYFSILLAGFYLGSKTLSVLNDYAPAVEGLFFVVFALVLAFTFSKIFGLFITRWFKVNKRYEKTPRLIGKIVSVFVYLIAALMILSYFNVEITPLIATLGLGGLAVGLALQGTLSNFFAGLHILSDKPIRVGDFIELEGKNISGYVEDVSWRSTRIKTLSNTIVVIPNALLAESIIINDSMPGKELSAVVQCGVAYGSDLKKVERVTIEVARKIQKSVPGAVKEFEPFIRFHTFGDSNVNFSIILRVKTFVDKYLVVHEFIKALKERYDKEKIEISWPVRKVYYEK